jgi:hypothetical protein
MGKVTAQTDLPEPMKPLAVLLGEWSGEGKQMTPDGNTSFSQTERVQWQLNGRLLIFNGKGFSEGSETPEFEAFGVMTYDPTEQQVYIYSWTADGYFQKAPVTIKPGSFQWGFDVPNNGMIRFTATFDESSWKEKGEYSPDKGVNWYPYMQSSLSR